MTWSDEFDGSNGSAPDSTKWVYDVGGGGWGNGELEYYTDSRDNSYIQDGALVIEARTDNIAGTKMNYTSARLKTQGKFAQKYGRFEARIQVPSGSAMWPAFWMMGDDIDAVDWPYCGEIDVMEYWGYDPTVIAGTTHDPGDGDTTYQEDGISGEDQLPNQADFSSDYHVYAMEWESDVIRFYVDGTAYHCVLSQTASASKCGSAPAKRMTSSGKWVFDHPFFILLNLAVDGQAPAENAAEFPKVMRVDYVRVYQPS